MRVLDVLTALFCEKYACDPECVEMAASLDELNIAPHEREDMAVFCKIISIKVLKGEKCADFLFLLKYTNFFKLLWG